MSGKGDSMDTFLFTSESVGEGHPGTYYLCYILNYRPHNQFCFNKFIQCFLQEVLFVRFRQNMRSNQ